MRVRKISYDYQNYKILLLDDDAKYVNKKVEVLKSFGYHVEGETVVKMALAKLQQNEYDLLILDYLMDEMRGDRVVEEIRKFNQELYILLLTGYAEAPALDIMNNLDITGYCEKSNDNTQLLVMIKSALKSVDMLKKLKKSRDGLSEIIQASPKIFQIKQLKFVIEDILLELANLMRISDMFILLENIIDRQQDVISKTEFKGVGAYAKGILSVKDSILSRINGVRVNKTFEIVESGVMIPLLSDNYDTLGVLYADFGGREIEEDAMGLLKVYTTIASGAITNALLQNVIELKNEELQYTKEEVATWYLSTVNTIRLAIDAKDHYTGGHSDRVSEYAVEIGRAMSLPEQEINLLRDSGVFHDVGKIGIDDSILKKKGKITEEEYEEIKKHPQRGALILSAVSMFKDIVPIVMYHHERYDGMGYPNGLKGEQIPFMARILCVADALDAMTSNRTYKDKKSAEEAIDEMSIAAGTQFDPHIVQITIDLIRKRTIVIKD